jgi:hypothetical protein
MRSAAAADALQPVLRTVQNCHFPTAMCRHLETSCWLMSFAHLSTGDVVACRA